MDFPGEKLVIKMWETLVDKGVGCLLQPWHEKRLGQIRNKIRSEEILMLADTERYVSEIKAGRAIYIEGSQIRLIDSKNIKTESLVENDSALNIPKLALRAIEIEKSEALRKEININKAILIAEDILAEDSQQPSNRKIEDDWLFSWRDYASNVSAVELQDLWGRILAGEIKSPGSYSLRALQFLKSLNKEEAEIISKVAQFVVDGAIYRKKIAFLEKKGIELSDLIFLQELGILSGVDKIGLTQTYISVKQDKLQVTLRSNNKAIMLKHEDVNKSVTPSVYLVSAIGKQIFGINKFKSDEAYLAAIAKEYAKQGFKVFIGDLEKATDSTEITSNIKEVIENIE